MSTPCMHASAERQAWMAMPLSVVLVPLQACSSLRSRKTSTVVWVATLHIIMHGYNFMDMFCLEFVEITVHRLSDMDEF